jgi:hypothetical protein
LGDPLEADDPGWSDERARIEEVHFAYDPKGMRFPFFAHIRKAYPRDLASEEPWPPSADPARDPVGAAAARGGPRA